RRARCRCGDGAGACRCGGDRLRARLHARARSLADGVRLRRRSKSKLGALSLLALALPQAAWAKGEFDPSEEFQQHPWVEIHLGPLDLSITKAVAYLMLGSVLTMIIGIVFMRARGGRSQALGEQIYEVAQTQVAEQGLPTKAIGRWVPYCHTLQLL